LAACVTLMSRGADLTYASVAAEAGVQERTVYRHFPKKEDLEAADAIELGSRSLLSGLRLHVRRQTTGDRSHHTD
jgi:AcrR family transcriptional regulator